MRGIQQSPVDSPHKGPANNAESTAMLAVIACWQNVSHRTRWKHLSTVEALHNILCCKITVCTWRVHNKIYPVLAIVTQYVIYIKSCMYWSGELFMRPRERSLGVYFPGCFEMKEINTTITLKWAHNQFVTTVHTSLFFLHDIMNP